MQSTCLTGGLRLGVLGSAASLAIAAPLAVDPFNSAATTDASRIGLFFGRTPGAEKIGFVVMGVEAFNATATNVNFNVAVNFPAAAANTILAGPAAGIPAAPTYRSLVASDLPNTTVTAGAYTNANITIDAQGRITLAASGSTGVGGSGTATKLPKWSAATVLADSIVTDTGTSISVAGGVSCTSISMTGCSYDTTNGLEVNRATATSNIFLGRLAGNATNTTTGSTALGNLALTALTSGSDNTAVGNQALRNVTTASNNDAFGQRTMASAVTGVSGNAAMGAESLFSLTTGVRNTALGAGAGYHLTNGQGNIFLGYYAASTDGTSPGTTSASNRMVVGGNAPETRITNVFIGSGEQNSAPVAVTLQTTSGWGTDIAGAALNIAGGRGTGTGAGGAVIFRTAKAGATGTALNGLTTRLSVLQDGAVEWTGITTATAPAVSAANNGNIFYDSTLQKFRYSANGAAYADLVGFTGSGTTKYIPKWTGATALGDSIIQWIDASGDTRIEIAGAVAGTSVTTGSVSIGGGEIVATLSIGVVCTYTGTALAASNFHASGTGAAVLGGSTSTAGNYALEVRSYTNALIFNAFSDVVATAVPVTITQGAITAAKEALAITSTWNNAAVTFTAFRVTVTNTASDISSNLAVFGTSVYIRRYGSVIIQQDALAATANNPVLSLVQGSHTNYPAGTELNCVYIGNGTLQWATGAIAAQRNVYIDRPTYSFVGASVITTAATLCIRDAPVASTNATITIPLALWVEAGATSIAGLGVSYSTFSASGAITRAMFYVTFTGSTAAQTLTLPSAALYGSTRTQLLVIRNKSSVPVAIARSGSDTIDGGTATINLPAGSSVWLMSDGVSAWDTN